MPSIDFDTFAAQEFPITSRLIYLNHAAVGPWPRRTAEAVKRFADENAQEGAANYPRWLLTEKTLREQCAHLINAPFPDDIALLKNTSEALSVVAHGFPWSAGDNVIISDEEFPSNRIVWESLRPYGVSVRTVGIKGLTKPEDAMLAAADSRTRLLSVSSVQYARGLRLDLARLGELCATRRIAFCVDAIQSLGALPHDVQAMRIDFLMADAHKWLLGPEGIAVFYCRPEWRERLTLREYGWHMVEAAGDFDRKDWQVAHGARRFECGSPNMLGIHALSASLSVLNEIGSTAIAERIIERAEYLFQLIAARPQLELLTDATPGRYAGIITFRHRQTPSEVLLEHLRTRGVICARRGDGVRFSPHFYTPLKQLETAIAQADDTTTLR